MRINKKLVKKKFIDNSKPIKPNRKKHPTKTGFIDTRVNSNTKIGLLVIATGKYKSFLYKMISSAQKYFLKDYHVTYYIFTDDVTFSKNLKYCKIIKTEHQPWPYSTLYRYKIFLNYKELLSKEDYLFYCDVDQLFVSPIGKEIFSDRTVVLHPCFGGGRGTPETNPSSTAYIEPSEYFQYIVGGFNGGTSREFLKMSEIIDKNIDIDMNNGIIAVWHDESHLNRYMIDNPPNIILDCGYCYHSTNINAQKKIIGVVKDNDFIRN